MRTASNSDQRSGNGSRAFTIIELLVSVGITALMLTLMVTISINMLSGWNRTSGQLNTGNQARVVLDAISQDLQSAVMRRDGNIWMAATVQRNQSAGGDAGVSVFYTSDLDAVGGGQTKPISSGAPDEDNSLDLAATLPTDAADVGKMENVRFGQLGVWLRFYATPPSANNAADPTSLSAPRAVAYQLSRGRLGTGAAADAQTVYSLFRSEIDPQRTFQQGMNITAAAYDTSTGAAGAIRTPTVNDIIATNVVDFGVRLFERDAAGNLLEVFPARRNSAGALLVGQPATTTPVHYLATSNTTAAYTGYGGGTQLTSGFPAVAEVMVRILTPEGARQIEALEKGLISPPASVPDAAEYWWQIVEQNSQVYVRRVEIRSNAL